MTNHSEGALSQDACNAASRISFLRLTFATWLPFLSHVPTFICFLGHNRSAWRFSLYPSLLGGFLSKMLTSLFWASFFAVPSWAQSQFVKGQKWQIILTGVPDTTKSPLPPTDAPVWDIDLFDSDTATISALKASGKIVICYFSAGT